MPRHVVLPRMSKAFFQRRGGLDKTSGHSRISYLWTVVGAIQTVRFLPRGWQNISTALSEPDAMVP
ncbi:hypothetical protein AVEN_101021-1, partial [Araneus ventricosus]